MAEVVVRGARQHNLTGVDLELDLSELVVFVGPSGSGKSSLAFDTLHAEGQRRYLEALALADRRGLPQLPHADVDLVRGLPPTVALSQRKGRGGGRSTVGSLTEIEPVARVLFGRSGVQHCPESGEVIEPVSHDQIVADLAGLPEGSRLMIEVPVRVQRDPAGALDEIRRAGFSRVRVDGEVRRADDLDGSTLPADAALRVVVDRIKVRPGRLDRIQDGVRTAGEAGHGVLIAVVDGEERAYVDRPWSVSAQRLLPARSPRLFLRTGTDVCPACEGRGEVDEATCEACAGTGLGPTARAVTWGGLDWVALQTRTVSEVRAAVQAAAVDPATAPVHKALARRLALLDDTGLGYLPLGRRASRLSSGERQRLRLVRQVGARLAGVLYVLDEPTAGLDEAGVHKVIALLRALRDGGNGVLVVEHHPAVVAAADRVVEFGPGPGRAGGQVVFQGTPEALAQADTRTAAWQAGRRTWPKPVGTARGVDPVPGLTGPHLAGDDLPLVRGALNVVVGPSGSGKSTMLEALYDAARDWIDTPEAAPGGWGRIQRRVMADSGGSSRTRRSMPATYVGLWTTMRSLLAATRAAQVRGLDAGSFSLNKKGGRCEACKGLGVRQVDLQFLPPVDLPCEVCEGRRFTADALEVRWKGHHAGELLSLDADDAHALLAGHPRLDQALRALREVGLGYLTLGQPLHTLSGGEAQRLKLARELVRAVRHGGEDTLIVLDDPTVGLHPDDALHLWHLLRRLVEEGATLVVATHLPGWIGAADHVVTLGPGPGCEGGRVVGHETRRPADPG